MKDLPIRPKLKDLEVGDRFYPAYQHDKKPIIYEVKGENRFDQGSKTRMCMNVQSGIMEFKQGRLEVVTMPRCNTCGIYVPGGIAVCMDCDFGDDEPD